MPPRLITAAILAFWLTMTGLLIYQEVLPMMLADVSPVYQPDLTDEIGSPLVGWIVLRDGAEIGSGTSKVHAKDDGNYEFRSTFHFKNLKITTLKGELHPRLMENTYRVTDKGNLLAVSTKIAMNFDGERPPFTPPDITIGIQGEVIDGTFEPNVAWNDMVIPFGKIDMRKQGSVVNPLHLINRLRGLRAGQTWRINLVDPFRGLAETFGLDFAKKMTMPVLDAKVISGSLDWAGQEVPCLIIEYRERGKKDVAARTWVRKSDSMVLQQQADNLGFEMILQRKPN